ncbi:hypothetical protein ACOMHN_055152 [Nucella lapillus]
MLVQLLLYSSNPCVVRMVEQACVTPFVSPSGFTCNTCGKTFTKANNLCRHRNQCERKNCFVCPFCCKQYYRSDTYKLHLENKHSVELLEGSVAGVLRRGSAMASHKVVTSDGQHKYGCHVCPKVFTNYSNLARHRRKCEGTGFYLHCPICQMPFYRRDNYQDHLANKHKAMDVGPRHSGRRW